MELLAWWNLIFVLPFIAALLYTLMMTFGLLSAEHGAAEADSDVSHDWDGDHDAEAGHELHADHDLHVDHDMHGHVHHSADPAAQDLSGFIKALSFLGLGRVPLSLLIMSFCFIWGFSGWASNQLLSGIIPSPLGFIWLSLAIAAVGSVLLTRWLALGISRFMPGTETYATSNQDLVGRRGEVRYTVTASGGTVVVHDRNGNLHQVSARVAAGEEVLAVGAKVLLYKFDDIAGVFFACADRLTGPPPSE